MTQSYRDRILAEAASRDAEHEAKGWLVKYREFRITPGYIGWDAVHRDYDGPEDRRCFMSLRSVEECKAEIDDYYAELADADRAAMLAPLRAVCAIFDRAMGP